MSTIARDATSSTSATLTKEARVVGLRGVSKPTLAAVDQRRSQLWTVAFAGLVCLATSLAVLASAGTQDLGIVSSIPFRIGTVLLVLGLAAYVMDKEHHLRRLSRMLVSERVTAAATTERLRELQTFHAAGTAMNSVLVIEEVLRVILTSAYELLHPINGSILLLEGGETLSVVCSVGHATGVRTRTLVGDGLAGRAALQRVPILVNSTAPDGRPVPTESAVCLPLIHRAELLGVLHLSGSSERAYTDYDLQSASLFADHAAIAIANARLNDTERTREVTERAVGREAPDRAQCVDSW